MTWLLTHVTPGEISAGFTGLCWLCIQCGEVSRLVAGVFMLPFWGLLAHDWFGASDKYLVRSGRIWFSEPCFLFCLREVTNILLCFQRKSLFFIPFFPLIYFFYVDWFDIIDNQKLSLILWFRKYLFFQYFILQNSINLTLECSVWIS